MKHITLTTICMASLFCITSFAETEILEPVITQSSLMSSLQPGKTTLNRDTSLTKATNQEVSTRTGKASSLKAGVVFTFDDTFIKQWVAAMPIFEKYQAHATFFITKFDLLNPEQILGLKRLEAAGHAIACHGLRHRYAVKYVAKNGIESYLNDEIYPILHLMRKAGFSPTAFAYPYSQRNVKTDAALLKIFKHLRSGTGSKTIPMREQNALFTTVDRIAMRGCLFGTGIDYTGTTKRPVDFLSQIKAALDRAKERQEIVVFYAHNISNVGPGHHLSPEILDEILMYTKEIGLETYTYNDLP